MIEELTLDQALLPPEPPTRETKHGGVILVDGRVFESLDISLRGCNTQGRLEDDGVFAEVHKKLLLPPNYTVRAMLCRYGNLWGIWVTSPDLPRVDDFTDPPELKLIYHRLGNDTIRLHKIEIGNEWKHVYAEMNACPTCGRKLAGQSSKSFEGSPYETQFALFADAVMTKLCDIRDGELVAVISDRWRKQAELVLAQCAYQFACHVTCAHALLSHGDMAKVPDLSELPDWPEEMSNDAR